MAKLEVVERQLTDSESAAGAGVNALHAELQACRAEMAAMKADIAASKAEMRRELDALGDREQQGESKQYLM